MSDSDYVLVCSYKNTIIVYQSINQSKRIYIAPYVAGESEARDSIAVTIFLRKLQK